MKSNVALLDTINRFKYKKERKIFLMIIINIKKFTFFSPNDNFIFSQLPKVTRF